MADRKRAGEPDAEVRFLLKKMLMLQLFELGLSQGQIAKKLRTDVHVVNDFLKGVKRGNG